jgi:tetraacyldisaccharide 4'-kinase
MQHHPETNLILLDDAFQHRYVRPGLNLLLTEYYRPFFHNFLLPVGTLRERKSGAQRADALIVTKTPSVFSPLDRRFFLQKLCRFRLKKILFSSLRYQQLIPLAGSPPLTLQDNTKTIFLYTGIAHTSSIEEHLKKHCQELIVQKFPDHHQFRVSDLKKLRERFNESISRSKIIVVTEKDAMRLQQPGLISQLQKLPVYCLPVEVFFHHPDQKEMEALVENFLLQYSLPDHPKKHTGASSGDGTPAA